MKKLLILLLLFTLVIPWVPAQGDDDFMEILLPILIMKAKENQEIINEEAYEYVKHNPDDGKEGLFWYEQSDGKLFNINKPTMIFVHGWKPDVVVDLENFQDTIYDIDEIKVDLNDWYDSADRWLEIGYNVGVYCWHRKASGWSSISSFFEFTDLHAIEECVLFGSAPWYEDLYHHLRVCIPDDYNQSYMLIGHSIGTPMVTFAAKDLIRYESKNKWPDRLVLLDQYGKTNSDMAAKAVVDTISPKIVVEAYASSEIGYNFRNLAGDAYQKSIVYTVLWPHYSLIETSHKHDVAFYWFLRSRWKESPKSYYGSSEGIYWGYRHDRAPCARTSISHLQNFKGKVWFNQATGKYLVTNVTPKHYPAAPWNWFEKDGGTKTQNDPSDDFFWCEKL